MLLLGLLLVLPCVIATCLLAQGLCLSLACHHCATPSKNLRVFWCFVELALAVTLSQAIPSIQQMAVCAVGGTLLGEGELGVCGALGHRASRPDLLLPLALAAPLCYS